MTTSLTIGPSISVVQSTAYALPPVVCVIHSTAALDVSVDGSAWNALANATTGSAVAGSVFVRCTASTNASVICRRY